MSATVTLERTEDVSDDVRVCHYDELDEAAKEELPALTDADEGTVDADVADGFAGCDLVKYTDYYEVSLQ